MSPDWNGKSGWNISLWRTRTYLFKTMSFDDLTKATTRYWSDSQRTFLVRCQVRVIVVIGFLSFAVNVFLLISPINTSLVLEQICIFLAATKQLYEWYFLSVRLSVTPFWLCSHHRIITKFCGVITNDKSDVHAKTEGQRSKVKVTEVK